MTWKRLPIQRAKEVCDMHGYDQVVILARHLDSGEYMATYGKDKANCHAAGLIGKFLQRIMQWPQAVNAQRMVFQIEVEFDRVVPANDVRDYVAREITDLRLFMSDGKELWPTKLEVR